MDDFKKEEKGGEGYSQSKYVWFYVFQTLSTYNLFYPPFLNCFLIQKEIFVIIASYSLVVRIHNHHT